MQKEGKTTSPPDVCKGGYETIIARKIRGRVKKEVKKRERTWGMLPPSVQRKKKEKSLCMMSKTAARSEKDTLRDAFRQRPGRKGGERGSKRERGVVTFPYCGPEARRSQGHFSRRKKNTLRGPCKQEESIGSQIREEKFHKFPLLTEKKKAGWGVFEQPKRETLTAAYLLPRERTKKVHAQT